MIRASSLLGKRLFDQVPAIILNGDCVASGDAASSTKLPPSALLGDTSEIGSVVLPTSIRRRYGSQTHKLVVRPSSSPTNTCRRMTPRSSSPSRAAGERFRICHMPQTSTLAANYARPHCPSASNGLACGRRALSKLPPAPNGLACGGRRLSGSPYAPNEHACARE